MFETEYFKDNIIIYDGYESQKNVFNYISGSKTNSDAFYQMSTDQIMEIVFKR